jgi:hypothetical protein
LVLCNSFGCYLGSFECFTTANIHFLP